MRTLLASAALVAGVLLVPTVPAQAEPLVCVDPGPTHVGPYVVDVPEVCLL